MKTKVSLVLAAVFLFATIFTAFPAMAAVENPMHITGVTNSDMTADWFVVAVTFDQKLAAGPVDDKYKENIDNFIYVNGLSLTQIEEQYPDVFYNNYVACGDDTSFYQYKVHFNFGNMNQFPDATWNFIQDGKTTVEVRKGLVSDTGFTNQETKTFIGSDTDDEDPIFDFKEIAPLQVLSATCISDGDGNGGGVYAVDIVFNQSVAPSTTNGINVPSIMNNFKINGKTLAEFQAAVPNVVNAIFFNNKVVDGVTPADVTGNVLNLNIDIGKIASLPEGFKVHDMTLDSFEFLPGFSGETSFTILEAVRYDRINAKDLVDNFTLYVPPVPEPTDPTDPEPTDPTDPEPTDTEETDPTDPDVDTDDSTPVDSDDNNNDSPETGDNGILPIAVVGIIAGSILFAAKTKKK